MNRRELLKAAGVAVASSALMDCWAQTVGSVADLERTRRLLKQMDAFIADRIAKGCGQSPQTVRQWMKEDTWFNAEEALAVGLVDEIGIPAGYGLETAVYAP